MGSKLVLDMLVLDMTEKNKFEVICSWCSKIICHGKIPNSHGICRECKNRILAEEYK